MIFDPSGPECYCRAKGCWESLASGTAIGAYAREQAASHSTLMIELAEATLSELMLPSSRKRPEEETPWH